MSVSPRTRTWLPDEDAESIVAEYARAGHSMSATALMLSARAGTRVSVGAISGFASRHGIEFSGGQPAWTASRRRNHSNAMREFWQRRAKDRGEAKRRGTHATD
jgi:hypothetical protein